MTTYFTTDKQGVRFTLSKQDNAANPPTVFHARRISDDRHLPGQCLFRGRHEGVGLDKDLEFDQANFDELVELWFWGHGESAAAPAPTFCYGCNAELTADHDTDYQFDNALWIKFEGGYGMFIDPMDEQMESMPVYEVGDVSISVDTDGSTWTYTAGVGVSRDGEEVPGEDSETYTRLMVGSIKKREDWTEAEIEHHERSSANLDRVVICHECAHQLCDTVPWVEKLLNSHGSHAHKASYIEAHPDHSGWDLDR